MHISFRLVDFLVLSLIVSAVFAEEPTVKYPQNPVRIIVMPYKLMGDLGNEKINSEHKNRILFANKTLRTGLQQTSRYDLVDEASSQEFNNNVTTALNNNACNHCESALAKKLNAKQIIVPWVYRLSQLVLTMHFVILDAESGKTILKKALDFRGDNDQSWERAIQYFVKNIEKP